MAIFDELKSIGKVLQEAGKIEQYKQILDTQEKLLDQQRHIAELEAENQGLKTQLETAKDLTFKDNAYYKGTDGPFCTHCYDNEKKLIRLPKRGGFNSRFCPKCKNYFDLDGGDPVVII